MNPRREAYERLGGRFEVRVLEPSPPAVSEAPWCADDRRAEADGARAAYGLSPGDEQHSEPYLYVAPWVAPPSGELWRGSAFAGAELSYSELLAAEDQRGAGLDFFGRRLAALTEMTT
jgi:hypothetical protein